LPDLIKFAYTPRSEIPVNGDSPSSVSRKPGYPDFRIHPTPTSGSLLDEDEHVLVLEFVEKSRGKRGNHLRYDIPPGVVWVI
jgi:DEAD/DEAH box helicase domain-containing protein